MPNIDNPPPQDKPQQAGPITVFRARCWARSLLCDEGLLDRQDSLLTLEIVALYMDIDEEVAAQIIAEEFWL